MTPRERYESGLRQGYADESNGVVAPADGYPDDAVFLAGMLAGRSSWLRDTKAAMIVDREPIT